MSLPKSLPGDTLQHILSSFRLFEKKLDKLQDDVSYHGQTLTDLRVMLANLSGGTLYNAKGDNAQVVNKKTAMDNPHIEDYLKRKRKSVIQPLSPASKVVPGAHQGHKYGINPTKDFAIITEKIAPPKFDVGPKRPTRQGKAEAPRKATTLRPKKLSAKKTKPSKDFEYPSQFKSPVYPRD